MGLLNIFQHLDGSTAWDTMLIILLAFIAGWMLHQYMAKRKLNSRHRKAVAEWEAKYKRLENDYKNYRANIASTEKHNDKAVIELNGRVKALEGDIRTLADEKNKAVHQLADKDQEMKRLLRQIIDKDDNITEQKAAAAKTNAEWAEKLTVAENALTKALAWEQKAKNAEAEAARIKDAVAHAERKKLEAELRLKAVSEYAGKTGSLEMELAAKDKIIAGLQEQLLSTNASSPTPVSAPTHAPAPAAAATTTPAGIPTPAPTNVPLPSPVSSPSPTSVPGMNRIPAGETPLKSDL
jgi:hypothetical protein